MTFSLPLPPPLASNLLTRKRRRPRIDRRRRRRGAAGWLSAWLAFTAAMPGIGRGLAARPFALAEGREGGLQDHNSAPLPPSPFIRPLGSNLGEKEEEEAEEEEDLRRKLVAATSRGILSPSPSLSPSTSSAEFRIFLKVFLHFGIFFFFLLALCWFFLARENGRENAALLLQTAAAHPYRVWRRPPQPSPVAHWRAFFSFLFLLYLQPTVLFPRKEEKNGMGFFPGWEKTTTRFFLKPDSFFYFSSLRGG